MQALHGYQAPSTYQDGRQTVRGNENVERAPRNAEQLGRLPNRHEQGRLSVYK